MKYEKTLPDIDELQSLIDFVGVFPVSGGEISAIARDQGFNNDIHDFLCLFSKGSVFKDRDDFLSRSKNLTLLINEERDSPYEIPQTPQG